jgi:hypothetical protein
MRTQRRNSQQIRDHDDQIDWMNTHSVLADLGIFEKAPRE